MSDETNCETGQLQAGAVGAEHGPGATLRDAMTGINADCPAREAHGVMERCDIYFPELCKMLHVQ